MAIKKQYLKSKPVAKVTLSLPSKAAPGAKSVKVVGDFTGWKKEKGITMKKLKNGEFKATVELPVNNSYQFRYLIDGQKWENDWAADEYISNGISLDENSVVVL